MLGIGNHGALLTFATGREHSVAQAWNEDKDDHLCPEKASVQQEKGGGVLGNTFPNSQHKTRMPYRLLRTNQSEIFWKLLN